MFRSTVYVSLIYCINLHWFALHVVKRYSTRDLSVFGMYSAVARITFYFQKKNDQYVVCFFYRLHFSYGAWNFGLEKQEMLWNWECMNIRILTKTLVLLLFVIYIVKPHLLFSWNGISRSEIIPLPETQSSFLGIPCIYLRYFKYLFNVA